MRIYKVAIFAQYFFRHELCALDARAVSLTPMIALTIDALFVSLREGVTILCAACARAASPI
jgi:hypothetical protein